MKLKREQFLVGVTTTMGSDWRAKIKEIDELGLEKMAIFLTTLKDKKERREFFDLLEKTNLKQVPFVHITGKMNTDELDYLIKQWNTKVFNIHMPEEYSFEYDYLKYKHLIYIENTIYPLKVHDFAGICLDFSHLEDDKILRREKYRHNLAMLKKYKIGCNHISAIRKTLNRAHYVKAPTYTRHSFENLSEFDYLKSYPQKYFSDYIAIELENSLKDQLKVIDYILKL